MTEQAGRNELEEAGQGEVLRQGDTDNERARLVFNGMIDRPPAPIVRCTRTADVIPAVNYARDHELLLQVQELTKGAC